MSSSNQKFERDFAAFLSGDDARLDCALPQAAAGRTRCAARRCRARAWRNVPSPQWKRHCAHHAHGRWLPALSAAAIVALAAGIAFQLGPQLWQRPASRPEVEPTVAPPAPPPAAPQPGATAAGAPQESAAPAAIAPLDVPAPPAEMKKVENAASRPAPRAFPAPARRCANPPRHRSRPKRSLQCRPRRCEPSKRTPNPQALRRQRSPHRRRRIAMPRCIPNIGWRISARCCATTGAKRPCAASRSSASVIRVIACRMICAICVEAIALLRVPDSARPAASPG